MSRRKGELTAAGIDRGWPHQIALAAHLGTGKQRLAHDEFCVGLSRCVRGHSVRYDDVGYVVHCFAIRDDAAAFMAQFGGEWFDPRERGRGDNWFRWYKGKYSPK
jgi:hypothetical protein